MCPSPAGGGVTLSCRPQACTLILGISRHIGILHERLRRDGAKPADERDWPWTDVKGDDISDDKTLGIIGFGRIGQSVARKMSVAFGMKIVYHDVLHVIQSAVPSARYVSWDELLATSDCELEPERTRGPLSSTYYLTLRRCSPRRRFYARGSERQHPRDHERRSLRENEAGRVFHQLRARRAARSVSGTLSRPCRAV